MAISKEQLRLMLSSEEPRYGRIAGKLDPSSIAHLAEFAKGRNLSLATKAIYLASLVDREDKANIISRAANSRVPVKKIAAASGLENLKSDKKEVITAKLIRSSEAGARKLALKSVGASVSPKLRSSIEKMSREEKSKHLKELSKTVLRGIK